MRCWIVAAVALALPVMASTDMGTDAQRAEGKQLYDKYCSQCHGVDGDGQGHATLRVKPQPRDFTAGKYKFRTTPSGMLPTDDDIARVIKQGLPYTSMPGWPMFSDSQVQNLVFYLKTFSDAFQDPAKHAEPIAIPEPPPSTPESVARGREIYEAQGCAACHGNVGRSNGLSGPTLRDDWGQHLRAVDMTQRWTFRGGPTRRDIFRTFSTGLNGTPMPSYGDSLAVEDRWDLVNYIYSLAPSDGPEYANLLIVKSIEDELELERAGELFEGATAGRFPLIGQITEPGRNFYPSITSVEVAAVYNRKEILFRMRWDDMRAETDGSNSPALTVPLWDEDSTAAPSDDAGANEEDAFWDDWGEDGGTEPEEDSDEDFWAEEDDSDDEAAATDSFSDAVALQFPAQLPTGIRKPYFIFGDLQNSVDIWFQDLAAPGVQQFVGRGSASVEPAQADELIGEATYDDGLWTVYFKRELKSRSGVSFAEGQYVPLGFSVWDGFNRERGNKRALSQWFYLYTEPREKISPVGPMMRAAGIALVIELLIIAVVRFRARRGQAEGAEPSAGVPAVG